MVASLLTELLSGLRDILFLWEMPNAQFSKMASLEVLSIPDAFAFLKVLIPREPYLPAWPSMGISNRQTLADDYCPRGGHWPLVCPVVPDHRCHWPLVETPAGQTLGVKVLISGSSRKDTFERCVGKHWSKHILMVGRNCPRNCLSELEYFHSQIYAAKNSLNQVSSCFPPSSFCICRFFSTKSSFYFCRFLSAKFSFSFLQAIGCP